MAHQERTSGIPLAKAIIGTVGALVPPVFKSAAINLGYSFVSEMFEQGYSASIEAKARITEAVFELRAYQIRQQGH